MNIKIKIVNKSKFELPKYETLLSSGMDVRADLSGIEQLPVEIGTIGYHFKDESSKDMDSIILTPESRCIIPTNLYTAIPAGYEIQVRPRSGQTIKKGFLIPNTPGTIDASYRGNIGIIVMNPTKDNIEIKHGERIAQFVLAKVEYAEFEEVETLDETTRKGGFGSTGID